MAVETPPNRASERAPDLSFVKQLVSSPHTCSQWPADGSDRWWSCVVGMMLAANGRWVPLETREGNVGCRDGANAQAIVEAARSYGPDASGFSIEMAQLPDEAFPFIAYWQFLALPGRRGRVSKRGLLVNDPAHGRERRSRGRSRLPSLA